MIWPGIVQAFQVRPTEPDKEAPYIANNINATRQAYDLQDVDLTTYTGTGVGSNDQEKVLADTASVPLVDPQLVHQSFEQIQQVRSYYSVADVLDVDRYNIDGTDRALVLGARELDQNGLPDDARNWSNLHTVYTHGNGIIAAFANQRPADDSAEGTEIQWAEGQQANQNALSEATGGSRARSTTARRARTTPSSASSPERRTSSSTSVARPTAPDILITTPESLYLLLTSQAREILRQRALGDRGRDPLGRRHQARRAPGAVAGAPGAGRRRPRRSASGCRRRSGRWTRSAASWAASTGRSRWSTLASANGWT